MLQAFLKNCEEMFPRYYIHGDSIAGSKHTNVLLVSKGLMNSNNVLITCKLMDFKVMILQRSAEQLSLIFFIGIISLRLCCKSEAFAQSLEDPFLGFVL